MEEIEAFDGPYYVFNKTKVSRFKWKYRDGDYTEMGNKVEDLLGDCRQDDASKTLYSENSPYYTKSRLKTIYVPDEYPNLAVIHTGLIKEHYGVNGCLPDNVYLFLINSHIYRPSVYIANRSKNKPSIKERIIKRLQRDPQRKLLENKIRQKLMEKNENEKHI